MSHAPPVVRSDIIESSFSLYTDDDIRALSVCKVTSPVALDPLGNPLHGGLEDPRFGPTDQRSGPCVTCGLTYVNCPGHLGHIDLCVPVYHPMHFHSMYALLRSKCAYCHQFRMSKESVRHFVLRLKLLEMGEADKARELIDLVQSPVIYKEKEGENENDNLFVSNQADVDAKLRMYEERYESFRRHPSRPSIDPFTRSRQQEVIDEFYKTAAAVRKCGNCDATSPSIRKDGYSKIFMRPLAARIQKSMDARKFKYKSALEAKGGDKDDDIMNSDDDIDLDEIQDEQMTESDKYLVPLEVQAQIELLWSRSPDILNMIWSRALSSSKSLENWRIFFMQAILVPPTRFRPRSKLGDATTEHAQNHHLSIILSTNESIAKFVFENDSEQKVNGEESLSKRVTSWITLQNAVNCYMDSGKDPNPLGSQGVPPGIKQILERKEGLFRKNMMGKRVNYCCRSVISPDPYIGTNEVGIPVKFAKVLHYPTPVCSWNVKFMRELVERGPNEYPGANQIEMPDGKLISLANMSPQERAGKAKLLLSNPGVKVYRHLLSGDVLLVNRQPSLHKPSIMAHKARVLEHVKEQTLRLNYANCNSYNADFDGDEMNCHFVQDELARAEAYYICNTDNQYIVPTSGNPLRGLIQDHVASGVKLTCKGTFLSRDQFQQLLYIALSGLPGTEVVTSLDRIVLPVPAILKPVQRWTGKQVISALIYHMCRPPLPPLHLDGKTRTPNYAFGDKEEEHVVTFRYGELLTGVMDKAAIGNSSLGIVHAVYELYGAELAGRLLTAFGRLFTYYLQQAGHTCGIEDLVLTSSADIERSKLLDKVESDAAMGLRSFFVGKGTSDPASQASQLTAEDIASSEESMARLLNSDRKLGKIKIDGAMQSVVNKSASDVIKVCLPNGLATAFPRNNFSMMVLTGAKGSAVNQSQISCFLGQQALEGQRVPLMISGKSLPSFRAYDSSARAGGFVRDRFLTGVKPQEYYFHCMAGREGLVDTAVKTSRSGYLQRCLVKHLEELRVHYDMTVRDSGGNVIQFFYGEDGLDPMSANLLAGKREQMSFIARNHHAYVHKFSVSDFFLQQGMDLNTAKEHHEALDRLRDIGEEQPKKNSLVFVRRMKDATLGWSRSNLTNKWVHAEVVKIRSAESSSESAKYDLKLADGTKFKRVPVYIQAVEGRGRKRAPESIVNASCRIQIVRSGLLDPAMSVLRIDKNLGSCSEKIQTAIQGYLRQNPDKLITEQTDDMRLTEDSFEMLVWLKYMRSLACPGEAVGCVAAQSVGEPSTQMTLNTFHLAGHGGANVTLGIPRLREIIMTASRTLKTPTMYIPLHKSADSNAATVLSRKLSQLPLSNLLSHKGGVEVRENLIKNTGGSWERIYTIRFNFENLKRIKSTFGVTFSTIRKIVEPVFDEKSKASQAPLIKKLRHLIQLEQRRAGESVNAGRQDHVDQFRAPTRGRRSDTDLPPDDGDIVEHDGSVADETGKTKSKQRKDADESEDEEDEEANEDDEDQGTLRFGAKKESSGYEEDDGVSVEGDIDGDGYASDESHDELVESEEIIRPGKSQKSSSYVQPISKTSDVRSSAEHNFIEFSLSFPASSRRLLMVQLAELAATKTTIRETPYIANAYVMKCDINGEERIGVQTEGVNFEAIWDMQNDCIDANNLRSNDIWKILDTYGVEAARRNIVMEINNVFGAYGIDVNPRHLSLIADFMTRSGSYVAMNRTGMSECPSPFLQMSFETTCSFLTTAAQEGRIDNLESPSARIVLGRSPSVGTGCFDLMLPLQTAHYNSSGGSKREKERVSNQSKRKLSIGNGEDKEGAR